MTSWTTAARAATVTVPAVLMLSWGVSSQAAPSADVPTDVPTDTPTDPPVFAGDPVVVDTFTLDANTATCEKDYDFAVLGGIGEVTLKAGDAPSLRCS